MLNDRARKVLSGTKGVDSKVDEVLDNPEGSLGKLFSKAEAINRSKLKKAYIESALLHTFDNKVVGKLLEIRPEIVQTYIDFYFDIEDWDRLSKIEHIDVVKREQREWSTNEAMMKMWTLTQGLDFLAWRLGKKTNISPVAGLQDIFTICQFKAKEAMFNSSTSDVSRESAKWVKLSADIGKLIKVWVMDSGEAKKELEIAIREIIPGFKGIGAILEEEGITPSGKTPSPDFKGFE